MKKIFDYFLY